MKTSWPYLQIGIVGLFCLLLGLFLGSEIRIGVADTLDRFIKIDAEITAYSPSKSQTDSNPFETASTQIVTPKDLDQLLYVAVSRNLLKRFNPQAYLEYGDKIYIEFTVIDTMHERWINTIDLFMRNEKIALLFGRQPNRTIIIERRER